MNKKIVLFFALCGGLFLWLCFYELAAQDMEVVELLTSEGARRSWVKLLFNRLRMGHPPLYFLMEKLLVGVTGHYQVGLYLFPIVTGALGIPLIYLVGKELGLGAGALWASLFWSVHPAIIYYSRYIRPQIGVAVLCTFYLLVLLRNLEGPRITNKFLLFALGLVGALWSHLFLFFWLGILLASLAIPKIRRGASNAHWWMIGLAIVAQGIVSVTVRVFSGSIQHHLEWVNRPSAYDIYKILVQALGTVVGNFHFVGLLGLICCLVVLIFNNRRSWSPAGDKWNLLLCSGMISSLLLLGLTFTWQPMWVPRYLVILLPVVLLSIAQALLFIPRRSVIAAVGVVVTLACVFNSFSMITKRSFGLREALAELEMQYDDDRDGVLALNIMTREAFRLYVTTELNQLVIKSSMDDETAWETIEDYGQGKERLWVLEFPRKYAILKTDKWRSYAGYPFYEKINNKLALTGYTLSRPLH